MYKTDKDEKTDRKSTNPDEDPDNNKCGQCTKPATDQENGIACYI